MTDGGEYIVNNKSNNANSSVDTHKAATHAK